MWVSHGNKPLINLSLCKSIQKENLTYSYNIFFKGCGTWYFESEEVRDAAYKELGRNVVDCSPDRIGR